MAFQYKISSGQRIDKLGKSIYVKDITGTIGEVTYVQDVNNPTVYNSVTNSTGYGAPNPTRASLALFLLPMLKKVSGDVLVPVVSNNPLTVTEFEVKPTSDGWYEFNLISVPAVASPVVGNYVDGNSVYNTTTSKLLTKVAGVLVEVQPITLLNTTYKQVITEKLFLPNNSFKKLEIMEERLAMIVDNNPDLRGVLAKQRQYDELRIVLEGSIYEFCRGNKYVAQKNIEHLNELYNV